MFAGALPSLSPSLSTTPTSFFFRFACFPLFSLLDKNNENPGKSKRRLSLPVHLLRALEQRQRRSRGTSSSSSSSRVGFQSRRRRRRRLEQRRPRRDQPRRPGRREPQGPEGPRRDLSQRARGLQGLHVPLVDGGNVGGSSGGGGCGRGAEGDDRRPVAADRRERDSGSGPQRERERERERGGEAVGDPRVSRESLAFSPGRPAAATAAAAALRAEGPAVPAPEDDAAWFLLLRRRTGRRRGRRRGNVWQAQRSEEQQHRGGRERRGGGSRCCLTELKFFFLKGVDVCDLDCTQNTFYNRLVRGSPLTSKQLAFPNLSQTSPK